MSLQPQHLGSIGSRKLDRIIIKYRNDLNLNEISQKVTTFLDNEKVTTLPELESQITSLEAKIQRPQFANARRLDLKALQECKRKKEEIISGKKKDKFLKLVKPILEKYSKLGVLDEGAVFGSGDRISSEDSDKATYRGMLISQFLDICGNFVPMDVEKKYTPNFDCFGCGYDLSENLVLEESSSPHGSSETVCPSCGLITQIWKSYSIGSLDTDNSSDYEDRENFIKAKERYQGKQGVTFPDKFYQDLDDFFTSRGLPTGAQVRQMEKVNGRRGPPDLIGKKILKKALSSKGYNNHYNDINLIAHEYWDFDLPDISHLDELLEGDYDKTERIFKQIKGPNRKATINTDWRLQAHLKARDYKVESDDFKIIETPSILEQYKSWWKIMIRDCGDPTLKYVI